MNHSALDKEVQDYLKVQEQTRAAAQQHHKVAEMETRRARFVTLVLALLKSTQNHEFEWQQPRRVPTPAR